MKANYTRDRIAVEALSQNILCITIMKYAEYFNVKGKAVENFINKFAQTVSYYNKNYEGYGHDLAVRRDTEKEGIIIQSSAIPKTRFYSENISRVLFILNAIALSLVENNKSKKDTQALIDEIIAELKNIPTPTQKTRDKYREIILNKYNFALNFK